MVPQNNSKQSAAAFPPWKGGGFFLSGRRPAARQPLVLANGLFVFYGQSMTADNIHSHPDAGRIRTLVERHVLELAADFPADGDLFEAGMDSMAIMQLLLHLEEEFGTNIPMAEVTRENFSTTIAIARLVASKSSEKAEQDRGDR